MLYYQQESRIHSPSAASVSDVFFVYLFFFANFLFCLAYVLRDMAWLRAITILAASCTLPYFYYQTEPLYSAMGWQIAFIVINGINLTILLLERRPVKLTERQRWLHERTFRTMSPREMLRLLDKGQRRQLDSGKVLMRQNAHLDQLILLLEGQAEVRVDGQCKAELEPGDFVGEMSLVTGEPTSAEVVGRTAIEYMVWERDIIDRIYQRQPELKDAIQAMLGMDMARKLSRRSPVATQLPA
jgi:hypothetical protein